MAESREYRGVPAPLEQYAQAFDPLFHTRIQRQRFRDYLAGLLLPRDRNKTLTALVGAEPIVQAQTAPVQQLQFFLSESDWDGEAVTRRRIEVLQADPLTRAHDDGVLVIDETGDRKDGTQTAHGAHQYLGSIGKIANGIVAVSSLWADERVYCPVHVCPYTPAARLAGGKHHAAFRTKPQLAGEFVTAARQAGLLFRAVVADSLYGEHREFTRVLRQAGVPYVLALRASHGVWAAEPEAHSPRGGRAAELDRCRPPGRLDPHPAAVPHEPRPDLVGSGSAAGRRRAGPLPAPRSGSCLGRGGGIKRPRSIVTRLTVVGGAPVSSGHWAAEGAPPLTCCTGLMCPAQAPPSAARRCAPASSWRPDARHRAADRPAPS
jgi:hypothetical protein